MPEPYRASRRDGEVGSRKFVSDGEQIIRDRFLLPLPAPRFFEIKNAFIAQLAEQLPLKEKVLGSIPSGGIIL